MYTNYRLICPSTQLYLVVCHYHEKVMYGENSVFWVFDKDYFHAEEGYGIGTFNTHTHLPTKKIVL